MRVFVCLLDPDDVGIPGSLLRAYESFPRARAMHFRWETYTGASVLVAWDDSFGPPLVEREGNCIAVGLARLDNRAELERLGSDGESKPADLGLLLHTLVRLGTRGVPTLLGDFCFVMWDLAARLGVAASDALSVKKLYFAQRSGHWAFANRAAALTLQDRYSVQFLAEQVAACGEVSDLTVYEDVRALPAGTLAVLANSRLTRNRYWSPESTAQAPRLKIGEEESTEEFRRLFIDAVRTRLSPGGDTWAQLSGGLDSSSVVSVAQWLAQAGASTSGLGGTVTYVDREATPADEREYSDVVAKRWRLGNHAIVDPPMWYDEAYPPPSIDQPRHNFMFYPRERRLCEIVRAGGGRVLLTGHGPDEYLRGTMFFFADWIVTGRVWPAIQEMARRAAIGRVSFWNLAYRNAVMPLFPAALRLALGPRVTRLPDWINPSIVCRYDLDKREHELTAYSGRLGHKYRHSITTGVTVLAATLGHLVLDDALDVRHPFLDRRLIEFGLGLPPEMTTRPYAGKWVLREAMRGILPERVRVRVGKGTQAERHAWSLTTQRSLLEPLVQDPILADLGVLDGSKLRTAFQELPGQGRREDDPHAALEQVLAVEAWLQLRAGRWPRGLPG